MKCLECGHELEVMHEEEIINDSGLGYVRKEVIVHCRNCLCDWQYDEITERYIENFRRKFWG